jgi:hypothetical protein
LQPSIRSAGEVRRDTLCAPTWRANYWGSLPLDSKFVSIVCRARMVSARDNKIYTGSGPSSSNTLRPVSSCCVLALGVFVVGVTNWSGEVVGPKSLGMMFDL